MKTICQMIPEMRFRSASRPAMKFKYKGRWRNLSWNEYYKKIESVAESLRHAGVGQGTRVALMSDSRPEWCFIDFATMALRATLVPLYHNLTDDDFAYIINDSKCTYLFIETQAHLSQWMRIKSRCPAITQVIVIGRKTIVPSEITTWKEFTFKGQNNGFQEADEFIKICEAVEPEDTATFLYTSGTTGVPKGVVITHTQILSEITETFDKFGITEKDSCLTFLPYAHILGRIEPWGQLYKGFSMGFAESLEKVRDNLLEIRPTVMVAVPRIFEKIYNSIRAQTETTGVSKMTSKWAFKVAAKVSRLRQEKKNIPIPVYAEYVAAKKLVFDRIRDAFGGRMRFAISGGAPLNPELARFFHAADILLLEGYGLTETTAAICANTPWDFKFGTVGKPMGDVELKVAPDGEILVKSDKVMKEYLNDPEGTERAFEDGWFKTGDIGHLCDEGFLTITDRKKDLIKTSAGKYIAPQKLESLLKMEPLVSNVLIHGEQRNYVVALLTLDENHSRRYAIENGLDFVDVEDIFEDKKIYKKIQKVVADVNSKLASYETIKKFAILPRDFTVENGELTPSMKVKRKFCDDKYISKINTLY